MSAFSQAVETRVPDVIVQLGRAAFADSWPHKPSNSAAVGLLLLSEKDIPTCRAEASKCAYELHPHGPSDPSWTEAYNDELIAWVLSLSACRPDDAQTKFFAEQQDEDLVKEALTPEGMRHLFDELDRATIAKSPVRREASDEELTELGELLSLVGMLASPQQKRLRKLASFMLDELSPLVGLEDEDDGTADI